MRFGMVQVGEVGSCWGFLHICWLLWAYAENFVEIHQEMTKIWRFEVDMIDQIRQLIDMRFGMVRVGEVGSGWGFLHISWLLWTYSENFMEIHQEMNKIWRFEVDMIDHTMQLIDMRFGMVRVLEVGSGWRFLQINWLLWTYTENFMEIHQELTRI